MAADGRASDFAIALADMAFSGEIRRALSRIAAVGACACFLLGCVHYPEPVKGLPAGDPWLAFPLRSWLAEGRTVPEALVACLKPECPTRIAVAVIRATGFDADRLDALLSNPDPLTRMAGPPTSNARGKTESQVSVTPMREGRSRGFGIVMSRTDGVQRAVYGAALGQRIEEGLRLILVIGDDADSVQATARRVAAEYLG